MTNRNKTTTTMTIRLRPAAIAVFKRRAEKQGRTLNNYMQLWLEDEAVRDHDAPATRGRQRKVAALEKPKCS